MPKTCLYKLSLKSLIAIISLIIIFFIFYNWLDQPIAKWAHALATTTTIYGVCIVLGKIFSPKYWATLMVIFGLIGIYFYYLKKNPNTAAPLISFAGNMFLCLVVCTVLKVLLGRARPELLFSKGLYGFTFLSFKHSLNSTPSGHSATAFVGLFTIASFFKTRTAFVVAIILATIISLSRIIVGAHYPADIIFGAYIGILAYFWGNYLLNWCIKK